MISFAIGFIFNLTKDNTSFIFSVHFKTFLFVILSRKGVRMEQKIPANLSFFFLNHSKLRKSVFPQDDDISLPSRSTVIKSGTVTLIEHYYLIYSHHRIASIVPVMSSTAGFAQSRIPSRISHYI